LLSAFVAGMAAVAFGGTARSAAASNFGIGLGTRTDDDEDRERPCCDTCRKDYARCLSACHGSSSVASCRSVCDPKFSGCKSGCGRC
jgi:hypothetical protein